MQSPSRKLKTQRKATMLRMEQDMYNELAQVAKQEQRSVNQQILLYISRMLAERVNEFSYNKGAKS